MRERYVHLTPRLFAASELLKGSETVADIGCDHGRLTAALLQQNVCRTVIASDISEDSLQKAESLLRYIGLKDRVSFRIGDGLSVLHDGECDAIALLGMGGTLMARILDAAPSPLCGAKAVVLQPMRAQADIRAYLHRNRYRITDDRIVEEHARLYQVLRAVPSDTVQPLPSGWPEEFFDMGFVSFANGDPLLHKLVSKALAQHRARLQSAIGTDGETRLRRKIDALETILSL